MAKEVAVVLNNGGINSAVTTALAAQKHRLIMLHVLKGETEDTEEGASRGRVAFDQQVSHFKPFREHVLSMPFLSHLVGTAGAKAAAAAAETRPAGTQALQLLDLLPPIAVAARMAAHYQAFAVYLGMRVGARPDELAPAIEFLQIWAELLQLPCGLPELEFIAPVLELEPWQVVDLGFQVSAPLERTWSCQTDGSEPCWACRGCRARESAFQQSAKPDPLRGRKG